MENNSAKTFRELLSEINITAHNPEDTVYHYTSVNSAKEILNNGTFLLTSPFKTNDPFEMHLGLLDSSMSIFEVRRMIEKGIGEKLDSLNLSFEDRKKAIDKVPKKQFEKIAKASFEFQKQRMRLMSFSKVANNTLLWSHYGHKHLGVCIGFKIPSAQNDLIWTLNVKYEDSIKPLKLYNNTIVNNLAIVNWAFTKSHIWSYEEEVRMLLYDLNARENDFTLNSFNPVEIPFSSNVVVEIYYGVLTPIEDIRAIEKVILSKNYPIEERGKMDINKQTFDLSIVTLI